MEPIKVIARFVDGRMIKGHTHNFSPDRAFFHVEPLERVADEPTIRVDIKDLKAVFIVRDFRGNPDYEDRQRIQGHDAMAGQTLQIQFKDGEVLTGSSLNYNPMASGFFIRPTDPRSNNQRVFVVNAAVAGVRHMPAPRRVEA